MINDLYNAKWEYGKTKTLGFYKRKLPWKEKALNQKLFLPDYFAPMIGNKKEVVIAELGAGMFCTIGSLWKGAKVQVYASDILANEYNRILKEKGIKPVVPVTREDMESLSYANDFFDIVYCVNALDHAVNPIGAIQEMYRVVKPGGWIYLKCFVNVGEKENYVGMHMWNVKLDGNNNLIIWNKEKSFSVNELFPGFKSSKEVQPGHEDDEMIISTLQK